MPKSTGYSCDNCGTFAVSGEKDIPADWIIVQLSDHVGKLLPGGFVFCTNKCAALKFIQRTQELDNQKITMKMVLTDEQREQRAEQGRRSAMKRRHRKGEHDDLKEVGCPLCDVEVAHE